MKANRPRIRLAGLALAAVLMLSLTACGSKGSGAANGAAMDSTTEAYSPEASADSGTSAPLISPEATAESSRKIIYTASVEMESTDYDATRQGILDAVAAAGAYLQSSYQYGNAQDANRSSQYCVRVPVENYSALLTSLGETGNVLSQSESTDDITTSYIDVEARLSALEAQRDRLNQLADQAETTADLLEIESQLSDVQYQIESYTGQLRAMQDQVTYSTVDIYLNEVATLTPTGVTFADRLADAFFGGWQAFVSLVQNVFLAVVYLLPLILVAAVIITLCVVLGRRRTKRRPRRPGPMPPDPPASGTGPEATYMDPAMDDRILTPDDSPDADSGKPKPPQTGPKY